MIHELAPGSLLAVIGGAFAVAVFNQILAVIRRIKW